jgi:hypothetical protein
VLKEMLKEEVYNLKDKLNSTNKILLVTHFNVLLAMSASGIDPNEKMNHT